MNAKESFAGLLMQAAAELEKVQHAGSDYFARGDIARVREAADRAEKIKKLMGSLAQLQSEWTALLPDAPTVREPQAAAATSQPPVQSAKVNPPHALRTVYMRTPPGIRTNEDQLEEPILQILVEMGGKGRVQEVLNRLEKKMEPVLNDTDRQVLQSRNEIRWRNTASWARLIMKEAGYLSSTSPKGTWEITPTGRKYLE